MTTNNICEIPFENENTKLLVESIRAFYPALEFSWMGEEFTEKEALMLYNKMCKKLNIMVPLYKMKIIA